MQTAMGLNAPLTIMTKFSVSERPRVSLPRAFDGPELAREALRKALKVRKDLGLNFFEPICPFDVAARLEIEVRLKNVPNMEGMFCRMNGRSVIVLASERPAGRQHFTCAHEIGHHVYEHGESLDEMLDKESTRSHGAGSRRHTNGKEFSADSFAGFLLMPRGAVDRAFVRRGFAIQTATPPQIYLVANYLGVGYATLVTHLHSSLQLLKPQHAEELKRAVTKLSKIRSNLTGLAVKNVTVVDKAWESRPVDLHVGDHLILPSTWTHDSGGLEFKGDTPPEAICQGHLYQATHQGCGVLVAPEKTLPLRISRQGFEGRSIYRHLDDPDG